MLIVTGPIASGKSTLMRVIERKYPDVKVIDADIWFKTEAAQSVLRPVANNLFGDVEVRNAAFVHPKWSEFIDNVVGLFVRCLKDGDYDVAFVPEFCKHKQAFSEIDYKLLTIERSNNEAAAIERDTHRTEDETRRIASNQSTVSDRLQHANWCLLNAGTKDDFERECEKWLESHLLEVLTHRTSDIYL